MGIPKGFHAIDEAANPIAFGTDKRGKIALLYWNRFFQELGSAANASQRVFDFVGEYCRHTGKGADRATVEDLAIKPVG
jgi:hypothetical protein